MAKAIRNRRTRVVRPLSAAGRVLEMIAMRHVPQAIHVVAVLGIADMLANGPKSSDELAEATATRAHALYRILRTLVAAGLLTEDTRGRFRLTALGRPLQSDGEDSVRAASILLSGQSELEGRLVDCVRTGKTAIELATGLQNSFDYFGQPARSSIFNAGMTALSNAHYAGAVDAYDFESFQKLVDVGGGHRRLLSIILRACPKLRGVLFDLPHAFEGA